MAEGDSVKLEKFAGLRNTVSPERLGPDELARARNLDIDDAGQIHRRRGYRLAALGVFHSLFTTSTRRTYVVKDGVLCRMLPGYKFVRLLAGITDDPLAWCEVGPTLYLSNTANSAQLDLASDTPNPWGIVRDPSYRPGLSPAPIDWWYSPVVRPVPSATRPGDFDLPPVRGKLLGAPYPCTTMTYFNGRIWMGAGRMLWATELYLYNYVDKNKGFRQFEDDITVVAAVDDGVWVGTTSALYWISGVYGDEQRSTKMKVGVVPGSVCEVPAEMISPNARNRLDLPGNVGRALAMMTSEGLIACLSGGVIFNLTRAQFVFPAAVQAASMFRYQDGMHTVVQSLDSGGTPANDTARFGDYMDARIIRAVDVKRTPPTNTGAIISDTILSTGVMGGPPVAPTPVPSPATTTATAEIIVETFVAGQILTAFATLMFNPDGSNTVVLAEPEIAGYIYAGMSLEVATVGGSVRVQNIGLITNPAWAWSIGLALFASSNGTISQVAPQTGFSQIIGYATNSTSIRLRPEDAIEGD